MTFPMGTSIRAVCMAVNARPYVHLKWITYMEVNEVAETATIIQNVDGTFDSSIELNFTTYAKQANLTCVNNGTDKELYHTTFYISDNELPSNNTTDNSNNNVTVGILISISILIFLLACTGTIFKLTYDKQSRHASTINTDDNVLEGGQDEDVTGDTKHHDVTIGYSKRLTSQSEFHEDAMASELKDEKSIKFDDVENPTTGKSTSGTSMRILEMQLPKIPDEYPSCGYSTVPEDEHVYYSQLQEKIKRDRIYQRQHMVLILDMKNGPIYNKWMGTIEVSHNAQKCVVVSTVTDSVFRSKDITWNVYVKRILDLVDSEYLVKIEGICIDTACLYLISEHFVCDTLETLLRNQLHSYTKTRVLGMLLDITRGIEMIHAFGFAHPGFSAKKVLVSQNGRCKLYDFCLIEDASKIVRIKKSMRDMSLNDLPPEALHRNEYSAASDIWCTAVVVWQIISPGDYPFQDDNIRVSRGSCISKDVSINYEEQIKLRDNLLQDCFSEDPLIRQTIQTMRHLVQQAISSTDIFNSKREGNVEMSDAYVPMRKAIIVKETYI